MPGKGKDSRVKWTYEKIKEYVEKLGDQLVSNDYTKASRTYEFKCGKCELVYPKTWADYYRRGRGCPVCFRNTKDYPFTLIKRIVEKNGDVLLSDENEYKNGVRSFMRAKCHKCGDEYKNQFVYINTNNSRCECSKKKTNWTIDKVRPLVEKLGDILVSDNIKVDTTIKLEIKCTRCGNNYFNDVRHIRAGTRCNQCSQKEGAEKRKKYNIESVRTFVEEQGEELISSEYIDIKSKLKIKCKKCGGEYLKNFDKYQKGEKCGLCAKNCKKTYKEVKTYIEDKGDILISKEYENCLGKLEIKCGKCGEAFTKTLLGYKLNDIKNIHCYEFKKSMGEKMVENYLIKNSLLYESQKKFEECRNISYLFFDFYVKLANGKSFCIEYNGKQHYKPVSIFGGEKNFKLQIKRDKIKKLFCAKNNIPLLIIPYTEKSRISEVLDNFILSLKVPKKILNLKFRK
tara:strand:- start:1967 stop:3334 length:1368 start_codon:yes stop_codon:yes gene_type:complete